MDKNWEFLWVIYNITVIVVGVTWLIFRNWEWIVRNWFPAKSNANFKLLVPELEYAIDVCGRIFKTGEPLPLNDIRRIGELISRLSRMELLPRFEEGSKPAEAANVLIHHLSNMLEYARAGKYKEYLNLRAEATFAPAEVSAQIDKTL